MTSIPAINTESRNNFALIPLVSIAAVAVIALLWFSMRPGNVLPVDSGVVELAQFVSSSRYKSMSLHERLPYMKRLRKETSAVRDAFGASKISKAEFDNAYLNGWMARQLDHMDEYYSMPEADRARTLQAEYLKPASTPTTKSSKASPDDPDDAAKDHFVGMIEKLLTPEELAKWEQFRRDVKAAKSAAKARHK